MSAYADKFWSRVRPTGFCWEWTGSTSKGYGQLQWEGKSRRAHRVAYELLVGPIPKGLVIDHLCRNHGCVNPDHLEPVTNAENVMRGFSPVARLAGLTHCVNGHEYTPENVRWDKPRSRRCLQCARDAVRRHYYRHLYDPANSRGPRLGKNK